MCRVIVWHLLRLVAAMVGGMTCLSYVGEVGWTFASQAFRLPLLLPLPLVAAF